MREVSAASLCAWRASAAQRTNGDDGMGCLGRAIARRRRFIAAHKFPHRTIDFHACVALNTEKALDSV
jgi:hypothetical protein